MFSTFLFFYLSFSFSTIQIFAFDNSRRDNVAVWWGQNSASASSSNTAYWQKPLSYYCEDDSIDVIPIAFLNSFFSTGGLPALNLANSCDAHFFPGTALPQCGAFLAGDIAACQAKGKLVTLSLGGATGSVGFSSDAQAETFALTIWNLFLGGTRIDLDIESGSSKGYTAFLQKLRSLAKIAGTNLMVSAAPQCVFPDASLGELMNSAYFDAIFVQFYNNYCGLNVYPSADWNFGVWDVWARTISINKNVKIYIAAPGALTAAGTGYVDISTLSSIAASTSSKFPSFGGIALWDASQAYANDRYDKAIKTALTGMAQTFTFPSCWAPAWASSDSYPRGSKVVYNGYLWQTTWYVSSRPSIDANSGWNPISACGSSSSTSSSMATSSKSSSSISSTVSNRSTSVSTTQKTSSSSKSSMSSSLVSSSSVSSMTSSGSTMLSTSQKTSSTSISSVPSSSVSSIAASSSVSTVTSSVSSSAVPTATDCASVKQWISNGVYTAGKQVAYSGNVWQAKWWTQGDKPNARSEVWALVETCTSPPTPTPVDCQSVPTWAVYTVYTEGKQIVYNSEKWQAQWWTRGDIPEDANPVWAYEGPCSSSSTVSAPSSTPTTGLQSCNDVSPWSIATIYTTGDKVTYRCKVYLANWWTLGDEPLPDDQVDVWHDGGFCFESCRTDQRRRLRHHYHSL